MVTNCCSAKAHGDIGECEICSYCGEWAEVIYEEVEEEEEELLSE
jgi:hypothetical protein